MLGYFDDSKKAPNSDMDSTVFNVLVQSSCMCTHTEDLGLLSHQTTFAESAQNSDSGERNLRAGAKPSKHVAVSHPCGDHDACTLHRAELGRLGISISRCASLSLCSRWTFLFFFSHNIQREGAWAGGGGGGAA